MPGKKKSKNFAEAKVPCGKGTGILCSDLFVELFEQRLGPSSATFTDADYAKAFPNIKILISSILDKKGRKLSELFGTWSKDKQGAFKGPFLPNNLKFFLSICEML